MVQKVRNLSYGVIKSGDGDDMRCPGSLEGLLNGLRDAGFHAEQNSGKQRSFGIRKDAVDGRQRPRF